MGFFAILMFRRRRKRRNLLLSHTHGRQHGEEQTDGQLHAGETLENVKDGHSLAADLFGVGVTGQASDLRLGLVVTVSLGKRKKVLE